MSNVASTLLPFLATMSKQRSTLLPKRQQCRPSLALKFRTFHKVERCFDIVAQNGNIVEATGNKVACCFDNVVSTLLLVWTALYLLLVQWSQRTFNTSHLSLGIYCRIDSQCLPACPAPCVNGFLLQVYPPVRENGIWDPSNDTHIPSPAPVQYRIPV